MSYKRVSACVSLFVWVSFVSVGAVLSIFLLNIKIPSSPACSRKKKYQPTMKKDLGVGCGQWGCGLYTLQHGCYTNVHLRLLLCILCEYAFSVPEIHLC